MLWEIVGFGLKNRDEKNLRSSNSTRIAGSPKIFEDGSFLKIQISSRMFVDLTHSL